MHIARFLWRDRTWWGIVEGEDVRRMKGGPYHEPRPGGYLCQLGEVRLLAPLERTDKVVGIAANYGEKDDRDGPGIFMKQPGTNVGPFDPIVFPRTCTSVIHEAELAIVIGRSARHVSTQDALEYVLGYTCANDVSAQEMTTSDIGRGGTMRVKHFDTFCPLGPVIASGLEGDNLEIQCRVNGRIDVKGSSSEMIFGVAELISWVSEVMTLYPGDIISTGCPGVGEINVGDTVEVEIEGIEILKNPVVADL